MSILAALAGAMSVTPDFTLDAIDWDNVSGDASGAANADETVAGINQPVALRATWSNTDITGVVDVNGSPVDTDTAQLDFTVVNGDLVHFEFSSVGAEGPTTVTVTNQTAPATLDTFTVTLTP